jgi:hypothetical protein
MLSIICSTGRGCSNGIFNSSKRRHGLVLNGFKHFAGICNYGLTESTTQHDYFQRTFSSSSGARQQRRRRRPPPVSRYGGPTDEPTQSRVENNMTENDVQNTHNISSGQEFTPNIPTNLKLDDSTLFVPRDLKDGSEITMQEYLEQPSLLSPWVPCPEAVGRKMLEIAKVGSNDVHYELGSGDGRLNFIAIDTPYSVKKSVGIDVDISMVHMCEKRKQKRHPQPRNLEFHCMDVLNDQNNIVKMLQKDECTVVTMYFVPDAIEQIKPLLETALTKPQTRVVSCGYPIKGWDPTWVEIILGLPIYSYVNNGDNIDDGDGNDDADDDLLESNELSYEMVRAQQEMEEEFNPFVDPNKKIDNSTVEFRLEDENKEKEDYHWDDFDDDEDDSDDDDDVSSNPYYNYLGDNEKK